MIVVMVFLSYAFSSIYAITNETSQFAKTNGIIIQIYFRGVTELPNGERVFSLSFGHDRTYFAKLGEEVRGFTLKTHDTVPNSQENVKQPFVHVLTMERNQAVFTITNGTTVLFLDKPKETTQPTPAGDSHPVGKIRVR